jgi:uncharacterized protein (UPF0332 family)
MIEDLIKYRLAQAEESISEAEFLFSAGKSNRSVINRAYYAMFYSILALQLTVGNKAKKHTGAISLFDKHFVKNGLFSRSLSKAAHRGFELRQMSDYQELFAINNKDVQELLEQARIFVGETQAYLKKHRNGKSA